MKSDNIRKLYKQEAEEIKRRQEEIEKNPLSQYSTSELKAELRRSKQW